MLKKWRSQVDTTIRLTYPTLKKQPLFVVMVVLFMYCVFVVPYVVVITSFLSTTWNVESWISLGLIISFSFLYLLYTRRVWRHGWLLGALAMPYLIVQEIALILTSMVAYIFGTVDWKGRNICYPVLKRIK